MSDPFTKPQQIHIMRWITGGFPCSKSIWTYRYQKSFPNTFCLIWVKPNIGKVHPFACLDVHYENNGAGSAIEALGGFWINGVYNRDLKAEQALRLSKLKSAQDLYNTLRALAPAQAPDSTGHLTYKSFRDSLRGDMSQKVAQSGVMSELLSRAPKVN